MTKNNQFISAMESGQGYDRRSFMATAGKGILAATVLGSIITNSAEAQQRKGSAGSGVKETDAVKLKPHKAASEKPDADPPAPLRPSRRVGYAIVGLGSLSLNQILPALAKCKYSKPVALVSGDPEKAKKVALQYGIPQESLYNYDNFDEIRNNPAVDVVYIVLPNSMHEEFTIRTAKAGKHVLCEKPMATSSASAQRMIDACKKAGRKLMIAYRMQYEPNTRQCMKWLREQKFGKVRVIDAFNGQNSGDPQQWRLKKALAGGGSLPDIGLYNLNTTRFLLGEEPETIIATIHTDKNDERFHEVEDTVMWQMIFPSGVVSNNTTCYSVHESRYYRCHTDGGGTFGVNNAFAYAGLQLEVSQVKDNMDWKSNPSLGPEKDQFAQEIDHMSDCVLHDKTPYTPGEEGLQDQKIMEAIYESARTGRPVKLVLIEGKDAFRGDPPKEDKV